VPRSNASRKIRDVGAPTGRSLFHDYHVLHAPPIL
jgi:hypothetical protein